MGDVFEYVEPRDALLLQKVDGVGAVGLVERREDVVAVDLSLARPLGLLQGVLQHALKHGGLLRHLLARRGQLLKLFAEKLLDLGFQALNVPAAPADGVARRAVVQQREQQMFERNVFVTPPDRFIDGDAKCGLELFRNHTN